jgi:hypothetical protein
MEGKNPKDLEAPRPWQPRIDGEAEFNPFKRTTDPGPGVAGLGHERTLAQVEEDTQESEAREDDPEPIKIVPGP